MNLENHLIVIPIKDYNELLKIKELYEQSFLPKKANIILIDFLGKISKKNANIIIKYCQREIIYLNKIDITEFLHTFRKNSFLCERGAGKNGITEIEKAIDKLNIDFNWQ